jgi:hypothetical protein
MVLPLLISFASWSFYKLISFFVYLAVSKKLKRGDLYTFTTVFGDNYSYRFLENGSRRYRWKKRLLVIKATFDSKDKLDFERILPYNIFTFYTEIVFK